MENNKIILINETADECRVGIVKESRIEEFFIEYRSRDQIKGNVYKAVVEKVQPSIQAAFVDFGEKKNGFLALNEVNYALFPPQPDGRGIQACLKPGLELLVQVTREPEENKGAALTTFCSFPGRYMVFMPNNSQGGISKRIEDQEQRDRLKAFVSSIQSEEHSVIIRTAGVGRNIQELKKDYTLLEKQWKDIKRRFDRQESPGLLSEEQDVVVRTIRDHYTDDVSAIWTDNPETYQKALVFMKDNIPRRQKDLKLFVDNSTLFASFGVEKQVENLSSRRVNLKSGGYLIIDQTEALVAIDVNSGRSTQESNTNNTAVRTNIEAAEEVARQMRLRNLGGLLVIDFIDMDREHERSQVEETLEKAMEDDKAQHSIGKISQFGLLELSRQRLSEGYAKIIGIPCPACDGSGKFPTVISSANSILRKIRDFAAKGNVKGIITRLPLNVSNYLQNEKREDVFELEREFGIFITLEADPNLSVINEQSMRAIYHSKNNEVDIAETVVIKAKPQRKSKSRSVVQKNKDEIVTDEKTNSNGTSIEKAKGGPLFEKKDQTVDKIESVEKKSTTVVLKQDKSLHLSKPRKVTPVASNAKKFVEGNDSLLKNCLFDVKQNFNEQERAEITDSFYSRLKGKQREDTVIIKESRYLFTPEESLISDSEKNLKGVLETSLPGNAEKLVQEESKTNLKGEARSKKSKSTPKKLIEKQDLEHTHLGKKEIGSSTDVEVKPRNKKGAKKPANSQNEESIALSEKETVQTTKRSVASKKGSSPRKTAKKPIAPEQLEGADSAAVMIQKEDVPKQKKVNSRAKKKTPLAVKTEDMPIETVSRATQTDVLENSAESDKSEKSRKSAKKKT